MSTMPRLVRYALANFGPYFGYIICTFYKQLADMENESKPTTMQRKYSEKERI